VFPELRLEYPEIIGGHEAYVLLGVRDGHPAVKFYFDEQSHLPLRVIRYSESPLGLNTSRIDYADYRDVDGVQVPFRVVLTQPKSSSTIQFEEIVHTTCRLIQRSSPSPLLFVPQQNPPPLHKPKALPGIAQRFPSAERKQLIDMLEASGAHQIRRYGVHTCIGVGARFAQA
jgi:hypothetical protein